MPRFEISVIVPTRNRAGLITGLLDGLRAQDFPFDRWELIVANDGSTDDTRAVLDAAAQTWPTTVTMIHATHGGTAAIRNAAATRANGRILLFLDDDMLVVPGLLSAHARTHVGPRTVVIGRIMAPPQRREAWTAWDDMQLARLATALAEGERRPGPRDLYGGNCSLPAELFRFVGGFATAIERGEDFDLGYRVAAAGAEFVYCGDAETIHLGTHGFENWTRNAAAFGRSEVVLSREFGYGPDFGKWYRDRHPLNRLLVRLCSSFPALEKPLVAVIDRIGRTGHALRAGKVANTAYSAIYNLSYWQGLIGAVGRETFWRRAR